MANSNSNHVRFARKLRPVCPAALRCKAFLTFNAVLNTETEERLPRLTDFVRTSNQVFASEKERCDKVFPFISGWMTDIPGIRAWNGQDKMYAEAESKLDIAFFAPALANWPFVIIEYKNEAHSSTKADPVAQATHYYLQQLQTSPLRGACNAPALILQIAGTHVAAYAVIHSGHDRNGPAFVGTHLLEQIDIGFHHTSGDQQQRKINAFWLAVKACVSKLVHDIALQLVTDLSRPTNNTAMPDAWRPAHVFPWIVRAGSFRFQYIRALGVDKMAFLARLQNTKEDEIQHIVVKFVNHARYAKEAHELLAREGLAPCIYHSEVIGGNWTMLLLQWMQGMKNVDEFKTRHLNQIHQEHEARALDILHSAGFVHGDLRNANVMVDESGRVCIIDFDWSGEHGKIRYPSVMHPKIQWPKGAEPNALIEPLHDLWWHEQRYAAKSDTKSDTKAETKKKPKAKTNS